MSRGLRNCNPGNIRKSNVKYLGEKTPSSDRSFKQFTDIYWGYRAMFVLLFTYKKMGYDTIEKMIKRYAPPIENHTERYIESVCKWSGIPAEKIIDTSDPSVMVPLVSSMSRMENGVIANTEAVKKGWELFLKHRP